MSRTAKMMMKKTNSNASKLSKVYARNNVSNKPAKIDYSIVIPAYNEEKNLPLLLDMLMRVMEHEHHNNYNNINNIKRSDKYGNYEIIIVNDGSKDNTKRLLESLSKVYPQLKVINFRKNFGQTASLSAGFYYASGEYTITLDADMQNDPNDIPRLINKMKEGYDIVSGWRKKRRDPLLKHITSRGANLLRKILFNDKIHDSGCTLKIYKTSCLKDLELYGEMHRFIPAILSTKGYKIGEVVTKHQHRKYGKTNYNSTRILKGLLDIMLVKFWMSYSTRPMHIFGTIGILSTFLGMITGIYLLYLRLILNEGIGNRPLLLLAVLLVVLGVQFITMGILADIIARIYYSRNVTYEIESMNGFNDEI